MQALILAGGKGTRLRPLTVYTPKPVVPVMNRPFLLFQIDNLKAAGVAEITLSLSYQPDKIEHILGDGSDYGVDLRYVTEPSPMGTGGAFKFALGASRDTTIVFNGDILTDLDVNKVVALHKERGAEATIALVPVDDVSNFGVAETDETGRILRFFEKPRGKELGQLKSRNINAGIYILEPSILDRIAAGANRSFEFDVFPDLLTNNIPFYGYVMNDGYWLDIGTPENYLRAHHDFLSGKLAMPEWPDGAGSDIATRSEIDRRSVLASDCTVKPGVRVTNSVIGPGVYLDERAAIEDSVIWAHTRISAGAEVRSAVIARSCFIGRNCVVGEGSVLGDKTTLTDYSRV